MSKTPAHHTERDFPIHTVASAPEASADALSWYHANFGMVPNLAGVMAQSPALLLSYWQSQLNLLQHSTLSPGEINIVEIVVAHHNRCQYCVAGHTAFGTTPMFNNTDDELRAVRTDTAFEEPRLEALRGFTVSVLENQGRISSDQLNVFLEHGYTPAQAMDVVAAIAVKVMSNFTNQLVLTPLDEAFAALADELPYKEVRRYALNR